MSMRDDLAGATVRVSGRGGFGPKVSKLTNRAFR